MIQYWTHTLSTGNTYVENVNEQMFFRILFVETNAYNFPSGTLYIKKLKIIKIKFIFYLLFTTDT